MASLALKVAVIALALGSSAVASVVPATHVEHEKRHEKDNAFMKRTRVEGHFELPVRIGLTQSNLDLGHDKLMEISDPASPNFGKHYTAEEVAEFFSPAQDTVAAVWAWVEEKIESERISLSANKQWIQFDATASELEALLHTTFHYYDDHSTGASRLGCDRYHVPSAIRHHIDYITPGIKYLTIPNGFSLNRREISQTPRSPYVKPMLKPLGISEKKFESLSETEKCKHALTPLCIKELYGIDDNPPKGTGNTIGIYEGIEEFYSQPSLKKFFQTYAKFIPANTLPRYLRVDGAPKAGTKPDAEPIEANIDIQVSFPLAYPSADVVNYQVDDLHYEKSFSVYGLFNTFLDAIDGSYCDYKAFGLSGDSPGIDPKYPDKSGKPGSFKGKLQCGVFKPTKVISFSYSEGEPLLPMAYQRRQCNEFMKLGLQGTSLIFSTGDFGVSEQYNPKSGYCLKGKPHAFGPDYPVNCPYVTAVGSTVVEKDRKTEIATTSFASGGGFSNIYPRPHYQNDAVSTYLTKHKPPYKSYNVTYDVKGGTNGGLYNRAGRAYPDVSAVGDHVLGISDGRTTQYSGTSVSAPLFAGIITRINSYRLKAGKKSLGFLNPALYAHPEMFRDVVTGDNPGCRTKGFSAAKGWDPVTGLGTPNYPKMKEILTKLP